MSAAHSSSDWWLASDGRWYPPDARPAPLPPAPPPPPVRGYYPPVVPAPTYVYSDVPRPPRPALNGWLQGLCWATAWLLLVLAMACITTAAVFQKYWTTTGSGARRTALQDWANAEGFADFVYGTALMVWLTAIILMMVWMTKAHHVSLRLWPGRRNWSSGWCVGGWFIPLANFVIPKSVMLEIERVIGSVDENGELDPRWQNKRGSAIGWVFWVGIVVALFLAIAGSAFRPVSTIGLSETDADRYIAAMVIYAIAGIIGSAGVACGALYFRALGRTLAAAAVSRHIGVTGRG